MPKGQYERYPGLDDNLPHELRRCSKCAEVKSRDAFSPDKRARTGLQRICKVCRSTRETEWRLANPEKFAETCAAYYRRNRKSRAAYGREWMKRNPHKKREYALKRRYAMTQADFDAMLVRQNNACAICLRPFKKSPKAPHIDHCHTTGKVREILCGGCNIVLGHMERPGFVESALRYLKKHSASTTDDPP